MLADRLHLRSTLGLLALLLAACAVTACTARNTGPAPTAALPPTPEPLVVHHTTALRPRLAALQTCARSLPGLALYTEENPAAHLPEAGGLEDGLILRLGEGQGRVPYAVSLGEEPIRVVVHPDSPIQSLDQGDLEAVFSGEQTAVSETSTSQPLHPWVYPPGDELSDLLEDKILGGKTPAAAAGLAPTPKEMREAVAEDLHAVGWLPESWLDDRVRAVDLAPDLQKELSLPILAIAPAEPQGVIRDFLICLQ